MANCEKKIQIQEFNVNAWFDDVKRFETDDPYRKQLCEPSGPRWHSHPVLQERGFYYVLVNVRDLSIIKDILVYMINILSIFKIENMPREQQDDFFNFLKVIQKNEKLFLDYYNHLKLDNKVPDLIFNNDAEKKKIEKKLLEHERDRKEFDQQINSMDFQGILDDIIFKQKSQSELAWRLTAFRTSGTQKIEASIIEKAIENIFETNKEKSTDLIKKLEKLGADVAFHSRTLTVKMAGIFMKPFEFHTHGGWHKNYCTNIFTRLIFPILNVIERPDPNSNIDHDAFVTMMLEFFEQNPEIVLKIFPTQLNTIFKLRVCDEDATRLRKFLDSLNLCSLDAK